jgi:hypothetical protein
LTVVSVELQKGGQDVSHRFTIDFVNILANNFVLTTVLPFSIMAEPLCLGA